MSKRVFLLRMTLGGAVTGCLVGILLGTCVGMLYGLSRGDLTFGLDGALLGGALACLPGALTGWVLGRDDTKEEALGAEVLLPRQRSDSRVRGKK